MDDIWNPAFGYRNVTLDDLRRLLDMQAIRMQEEFRLRVVNINATDDEFIRMYWSDENQGGQPVDYSRQRAIEGLNPAEQASVIGVGGTGFWVAVFLAMQGTKKIALYDSDKVEMSNLARIPITNNFIGQFKVDACARFIRNIRPDCHVDVFRTKIEDENVAQILYNTVYCCTDNLKSQVLIQRYCMEHELHYQRCGYDGASINVSRATPFIIGEDNTPDGYQINPSWVVPASISAALAVCSQSYKEVSVTGSLGKLGVINEFNVNPEALAEMKGNMCGKCQREDSGLIMDKIAQGEYQDYGYCGTCDRVTPQTFQQEIHRYTQHIEQQRQQLNTTVNNYRQLERNYRELQEKERQQAARIQQLQATVQPTPA